MSFESCDFLWIRQRRYAVLLVAALRGAAHHDDSTGVVTGYAYYNGDAARVSRGSVI